MHKRRGEAAAGIDLSLSDEEALRQYFRSPYARVRSSYDKIYAEVRKIFDEEDVHVDFYERLFSEEAVRSISDSLEISADYSFVKQKFNASPKQMQISYSATAGDRRRIFGCLSLFSGSVPPH